MKKNATVKQSVRRSNTFFTAFFENSTEICIQYIFHDCFENSSEICMEPHARHKCQIEMSDINVKAKCQI